MDILKSDRGFFHLMHPIYPPNEVVPERRVVSESSAIGPYPDSLERPGSSYLFVGEFHHLNREEVRDLVSHLQCWLDAGRLRKDRWRDATDFRRFRAPTDADVGAVLHGANGAPIGELRAVLEFQAWFIVGDQMRSVMLADCCVLDEEQGK